MKSEGISFSSVPFAKGCNHEKESQKTLNTAGQPSVMCAKRAPSFFLPSDGCHFNEFLKMKLVCLTSLFVFVLCSLNGGICAGSDLFKPIDDQFFIKDNAVDFQQTTPVSRIQTDSLPGGNSLLELGLIHKYLGYGTLLLAAAAAITGSDSSTHHNLAVGATTLGALTVATGYYEYGDMFEMDEGLSRYNLHIALGTLGAIGFAAEAVIAGTDSSHGGLGIASAAAMGTALIIIVW